MLKNKVPENALEYNLKDERISDYGALFARGFRRPYAPAPMELVIDGEVMKTSCYPKKGYFSVGEVVDPGAISVNTDSPDFSNRGGSFKFDDKKVSGWEYTDDILVSGYLACGFADDTIPVKRIDTVHKIIELSSAVMYGVKSNHCTKYKFVNVLDELSEEKEYYIDRKNGKLYFIPPKNFNKKNRTQIPIKFRFCLNLHGKKAAFVNILLFLLDTCPVPLTVPLYHKRPILSLKYACIHQVSPVKRYPIP